jgi:DUF3048 family protein/PEGA domain-containing protein
VSSAEFPSLSPDELPTGSQSIVRHWTFLTVGVGVVLGLALFFGWPESVVVVDSTPGGAEVTVDGQGVGSTPLRLAARPWPLRGQARLRLPGYREASSALGARPGETQHLTVKLEPLPGNLSLTSNPAGSTVTLDGKEVGRTPLVVKDLAAGSHKLALTLSGYESWQAAVELNPSEEIVRDVQLVPSPRPTAASVASLRPADSGERIGASPGPPTSGPVLESLATRDPTRTVYPVAIMVENAADARPQSGLAAADVVYEALAEGGITRFMALYINGNAEVVGPVRSARHYFVNLAAEFGASLVHIGASPQGYEALHALGVRNLDETFGHPGFWRSRARLAPHNAYTSIAGARSALDSLASARIGSWAGFSFKDPSQPLRGTAAANPSVEYRPWGYRVEYRYDPQSRSYARFMDGAPHNDVETHAQIRAANVVVLLVPSRIVDLEGRLDLSQIGTGSALYFEDGVVVEGSWNKLGPADPTRYLDRTGRPVRFNPGPIWVQIIPPESLVSY